MWYVQCSILKSTITHVATMAMITFWTCGFWIAAFYVYFCKSKSAQYFSKYKGRPCLSVLWAVRILLSLRDKMDNIKHQAKTVKCFAVIDRFYVRVWVFLKCNCKKHLVGKCWKTSFQASNVPSSMELKLAAGNERIFVKHCKLSLNRMTLKRVSVIWMFECLFANNIALYQLFMQHVEDNNNVW